MENGQKVLVAVSGGPDSVCLAHILHSLGYEIAIAHCNFQLRAEESDADQAYVEQFAASLGVQLFVKSFDVHAEMQRTQGSVQMAARSLRYAWFAELQAQFGFDRIAVGQHAGDQAETLLLNLVRGTGAQGMGGMRSRKGDVVRPLLATSKLEIENYLKENGLQFRIDISNDDNKYKRNLIRNEVLPLLEKLNPSVVKTLNEEAERFQVLQHFLDDQVAALRSSIVSERAGIVRIDIDALMTVSQPSLILFELLKEYAFNSEQVAAIYRSLEGESGKVFCSQNFQLTKERNCLEIVALTEGDDRVIFIEEGQAELLEPVRLRMEVLKRDEIEIPSSNMIACLDADKLLYPLSLRKKQTGDFFYPLGMDGRKLLSDYFIDNKFSKVEKESTWLLQSGDDLVWIVGRRLDRRYRVTADTQRVMRIELS